MPGVTLTSSNSMDKTMIKLKLDRNQIATLSALVNSTIVHHRYQLNGLQHLAMREVLRKLRLKQLSNALPNKQITVTLTLSDYTMIQQVYALNESIIDSDPYFLVLYGYIFAQADRMNANFKNSTI